MLAIDFPGKKRIFITNNTTREMINDIKMMSFIISLVVLFVIVNDPSAKRRLFSDNGCDILFFR